MRNLISAAKDGTYEIKIPAPHGPHRSVIDRFRKSQCAARSKHLVLVPGPACTEVTGAGPVIATPWIGRSGLPGECNRRIGSVHEPVSKRHPMIDMEEFERRLRRRSSGTRTDDPLAELARLTSGQQDPFQRVAEPQGQSSTEARQVATSSSEAQETEAQEPDALQSLDDDNTACQGPGTVNEEIVSRRSLYIMIVA